MAHLNENVRTILAHLKTKGLSIKDVSDLADWLSLEDRERFYKWLRRVKTEPESRSNPKFERALLCILHSFRVTGYRRTPLPSDFMFNAESCLRRFEMVEALGGDWLQPHELDWVRRMMEVFSGNRRHLAVDILKFIERELPKLEFDENELLHILHQPVPKPILMPSPHADVEVLFLEAVNLNPDILVDCENPEMPWVKSGLRNSVRAKMEDGATPEEAIAEALAGYRKLKIQIAGLHTPTEPQPPKPIEPTPPLVNAKPTVDGTMTTLGAYRKRHKEKTE